MRLGVAIVLVATLGVACSRPTPTRPSSASPDGARCPPQMAETRLLVPYGYGTNGPFVSGAEPTESTMCLDRLEVTNDDYRSCVTLGVCDRPVSCANGGTCDYDARSRKTDPALVALYQASIYCAWRSARLPRTQEWQAAVRGARHVRRYPWGNEPPTRDRVCWHRTEEERTCPVGSRSQDVNSDGIFDLVGNASEWMRDAGGSRGSRHAAGGGWSATLPLLLPNALPGYEPWEELDFGFRCARNIGPASDPRHPIAMPSDSTIRSATSPPRACPAEMERVTAGSTVFCIDRTEVTGAAYEHCLEADVCDDPGGCYHNPPEPPPPRPCDYDPEHAPRRPVLVSYFQAALYCTWSGKRLASQTERRAAATAIDPGNEREWVWTPDTRFGARAIEDASQPSGNPSKPNESAQRVSDHGSTRIDAAFRCAL